MVGGWSSLPAVASPAFSVEPPYVDDHVRERHPEVDHPPHSLRAPNKLLVGVVPRARPLHHPSIRGPIRRGLTLPRDLPSQLQLLQALAGELRVVSAIEVDARPLGKRPKRLCLDIGLRAASVAEFIEHRLGRTALHEPL